MYITTMSMLTLLQTLPRTSLNSPYVGADSTQKCASETLSPGSQRPSSRTGGGDGFAFVAFSMVAFVLGSSCSSSSSDAPGARRFAFPERDPAPLLPALRVFGSAAFVLPAAGARLRGRPFVGDSATSASLSASACAAVRLRAARVPVPPLPRPREAPPGVSARSTIRSNAVTGCSSSLSDGSVLDAGGDLGRWTNHVY
jgi:hypothetical protein